MASPPAIELLLLPAELLLDILSHLEPQPLLQFAGSCHACAQAAGADVLWREHIRSIWQEEVPNLNAIAARDFYRCMRQPPVVMTAAGRASMLPQWPQRLSDLMLHEGTRSVLGEYHLLIEVSLDEDGRKLLTAVVQPFNGMLSRGPASGCRIPAGQRTAAFSTAAPPDTGDLSPSGNSYSKEWLREAFGDDFRGRWDDRTPVRRLSARLCVQWQDKVVCLGVAPGMYPEYTQNSADSDRDRCELVFRWHMPAIALPDVVADAASSGGWMLSNISPVLFVNFEACSAARDTWKADSFELQVQPKLRWMETSINDGQEAEDDFDYDGPDRFWYDGFDEDCESDMMALCFLHEAMAMSRRSVERYARSGEEEEDAEDV